LTRSWTKIESVIGDTPGRTRASIVIVTRNRKPELRAALESATTQRGGPEILVMDDASTDGTAEMVQAEFPQVRLVRSDAPRGYIAQRNLAARVATGDVIVSLDDDARFSSPDTVATTLEEFGDPRVGAVAMPFIHTHRGPELLQCAPTPNGVWTTNAYIGTAHAVRRDLFLRLGGYREALGHYFEEPDLCIRLMQAGSVVRLGRAEPILHHESARRDPARGIAYLSRNHVLFTWFHVPFPDCVPRFLGVVAYAVAWGLRSREPVAAVKGLRAGFRYVAGHPGERAPVTPKDYRRWRSLRRRPALLA
jgi:GT2 family glycosyltransferase